MRDTLRQNRAPHSEGRTIGAAQHDEFSILHFHDSVIDVDPVHPHLVEEQRLCIQQVLLPRFPGIAMWCSEDRTSNILHTSEER